MLLENDENRNCGCMNNMTNSNCGCNNNNCELCKMGYDNGATKSGAEMMDYDCDFCMPQGINAAFGYNTASMNDDNNVCKTPEQCCAERRRIREEMIHNIKCLNFSVIELGLYLNTHHNDEKALCLHREYTKELKELKDQYQRIYGPLSIYYPCRKWRWLEEPWPWEGGNI